MGKPKEEGERDEVRELWIRWCDLRGLVSSETPSVAPDAHVNAHIHTYIYTLYPHTLPNPPQPINKHLAGSEIQYRQQH